MSTPPVVLLHGWGLTPRVWDALRAALPSALTVLAPPLPGHADAPPAGGPWLPEWSEALLSSVPDGSLLCGWSLGGLIALDIAHRHPAKVSRLVLIGTTPCFVARDAGERWPHGLAADTVAAFMAGFDTTPEATLQRFMALQAIGDARRRAVSGGLGAALAPTAGARHAALADGLRVLADSDQRAIVARIEQPVRMVHGAHDALMPAGAAHWLAARLPHATLTVLDDCGHAPLLSRPADCAALIEASVLD